MNELDKYQIESLIETAAEMIVHAVIKEDDESLITDYCDMLRDHFEKTLHKKRTKNATK